MRARVIQTTGDLYWVADGQGQVHEVRAKGTLRMRGIRSTSPVAVGDWVQVRDGLISEIEDRSNYIVRRASNLSKYSHVLAANLDQALLLVTLSWPETALEFVDRFLVTAQAYGVPVTLVFNKTDLYTPLLEERYESLRKVYEAAGYPCLRLSLVSGEGLEAVRALLPDKVTLLSGNSGVGKSSLLNALDPSLATRVGDVSEAHGKGMHTTTFSRMYPLENGYVIDTPGVKGFGVVNLTAADIAKCFPEMLRLSGECKFRDCTHTHEAGCAVAAALERGGIAPSRYGSYLSLLADLDPSKYR